MSWSRTNDAYVDALEKQCKDWEAMYQDVCAERDQLKQQLAIATGGASAMTEKATPTPQQLRHV